MKNLEIHKILKKTRCIRDFARFCEITPATLHAHLKSTDSKHSKSDRFAEYVMHAAKERGIKPPKSKAKSAIARKSGRINQVRK